MEFRKNYEVTRKVPTDNSKSVESACKSIYWFNGNLIFLSLVQIYKEEFSFSKIQRSQKTCAFPFKKSKRFTMLKSLWEEEERLSKKEKGNNELHTLKWTPHPPYITKFRFRVSKIRVRFSKLRFPSKIFKNY